VTKKINKSDEVDVKWDMETAGEADLAGVKEEALDQESQEKCIKQFALNAAKNARFLSSQQKASRFTAKNVTGKEELTKLIILKT